MVWSALDLIAHSHYTEFDIEAHALLSERCRTYCNKVLVTPLKTENLVLQHRISSLQCSVLWVVMFQNILRNENESLR